MRRRLLIAAAIALAAVLAWVLFVGLPRWAAARDAAVPPPKPAAAAAEAARRIRARLFHVAEDGWRLQTTDAEVEFAEQTIDQARHLVQAQLRPAPEPLTSAIPAGTTLREVFITNDGIAYVDLGGAFATAHRGGTHDEILTVYSVVNVLTDNLPAIRAVQILVDGREVDTLAGHVDLRRPLEKDLALLERPSADAPKDAPAPPR